MNNNEKLSYTSFKYDQKKLDASLFSSNRNKQWFLCFDKNIQEIFGYQMFFRNRSAVINSSNRRPSTYYFRGSAQCKFNKCPFTLYVGIKEEAKNGIYDVMIAKKYEHNHYIDQKTTKTEHLKFDNFNCDNAVSFAQNKHYLDCKECQDKFLQLWYTIFFEALQKQQQKESIDKNVFQPVIDDIDVIDKVAEVENEKVDKIDDQDAEICSIIDKQSNVITSSTPSTPQVTLEQSGDLINDGFLIYQFSSNDKYMLRTITIYFIVEDGVLKHKHIVNLPQDVDYKLFSASLDRIIDMETKRICRLSDRMMIDEAAKQELFVLNRERAYSKDFSIFYKRK